MRWDEAKEVQLIRDSVKHTMPIWGNLPSGPVSIRQTRNMLTS